MRESQKLTSARFGRLALVSATLAAAAGCVIEESACGGGGSETCGTSGTWDGAPAPPGHETVIATIDTNEVLETEPGRGIGAFIEYAQGGRWHVYTACDTELSGQPCHFNVIASFPAGSFDRNVSEEALEHDDAVYEYSDALELVAVSTGGFDGMYFTAPAGQQVRFEVWWNDQPDARFVYWVGGGAVHAGSPSNPIDLRPSAP